MCVGRINIVTKNTYINVQNYATDIVATSSKSLWARTVIYFSIQS